MLTFLESEHFFSNLMNFLKLLLVIHTKGKQKTLKEIKAHPFLTRY